MYYDFLELSFPMHSSYRTSALGRITLDFTRIYEWTSGIFVPGIDRKFIQYPGIFRYTCMYNQYQNSIRMYSISLECLFLVLSVQVAALC